MLLQLNEIDLKHKARLASLNAIVQSETGIVRPYIGIVVPVPAQCSCETLGLEFLDFLIKLRNAPDINLLKISNGSLNLGSTSVNGVYFQGDISQQLRIRGRDLIIPEKNLLLGVWRQDNARKQIYRAEMGGQYECPCNSLGLFCPGLDYPAKAEMTQFLDDYYLKFG